MTNEKPSHSRFSAALAALLFLTAAACGLSEDAYVAPKDASADAKGGGAGTSAAGGGAGTGIAGNFGGSGVGGSAGSGGMDTVDADAAVADEPPAPPPVCPADAMPIDGTGNGLKGEYFVGQDPTNLTNLKVTRYDATVDFDWGLRAPEAGIPADHFSVRWTGQVQPRYSDSYTFFTTSDDGVRLTGNNTVVIH